MDNKLNYKKYKLIPIEWISIYDNLVDYEKEVKQSINNYKKMEIKVFNDMNKELTLTQIAKILAVKNNPNYSYQNIPKNLVNKYKIIVKEKLEKINNYDLFGEE